MKCDKLRTECESERAEGANKRRREREKRKRDREIYRRTALNFVTAMWVEARVDLSIAEGYLYRCNLLSPRIFVLLCTLLNSFR